MYIKLNDYNTKYLLIKTNDLSLNENRSFKLLSIYIIITNIHLLLFVITIY